jgi:hypothetical protein
MASCTIIPHHHLSNPAVQSHETCENKSVKFLSQYAKVVYAIRHVKPLHGDAQATGE